MEQRQAAPVLYRALQAGATAIRAGTREGATIQRVMARTVAREPLATVEYLAVCHPTTLEPLRVIERHAVLLGVIRVGAVRLLDNLLVTYRHRS